MDEANRQHYETLLQLHKAQLRRLELKIAGFGALNVPNHIQHELEAELAAIVRIEALLNPPAPVATGADVRIVDDNYYPELLKRYGITILRVVDATTFVIACNHCDGAGRRPHTVMDWKVKQWYEQACGVCKGKGVVMVQVDDYLVPDARCDGSGKARPNAKTRDIKYCAGCRGLGVRSATGNIKVLE